MMKKAIALMIVLTTLLICLPVLPVAAATAGIPATFSDRTERLAQRQEILKLRMEILENRMKILSQISVNNQLRLEIRAKITPNKGKIPADTISQLKAFNLQIKTLNQALRDTQGEIKAINERLRAMDPKTDFVAFQAALKEIGSIQELRLEKLKAINVILHQMLALKFNTGS